MQYAGINVLKEEFQEGTNDNVSGGVVYGAFETRPIWQNKGPQPMAPLTDQIIDQAINDDLEIADLKLQPNMALPWAAMKECKLYNTDEDRLKGKIDFLRSQLGFLPLDMSRNWQQSSAIMTKNIKVVSFENNVQVIPKGDEASRMAILNALVPLETEYALQANESQFRNDFKEWLEGKRPTHEYAPCAWLDDKTKKMVPLAGRDDGTNKAVLQAARSLVTVNPGFARTGILFWENIARKARERRVRRRLAAMTPMNDEEAWVYYSIVVRKMPLEFIATHALSQPPPEEKQPETPQPVVVNGDVDTSDLDTIPGYVYSDLPPVDDDYDEDGNPLGLSDDQKAALNANVKQQLEVWRDAYYKSIPQFDPVSIAKRKVMHGKFLKKTDPVSKELVNALSRQADLEKKVNAMTKSQTDALKKWSNEKTTLQRQIADSLQQNDALRNDIKALHQKAKLATGEVGDAQALIAEARILVESEQADVMKAFWEEAQKLESDIRETNEKYVASAERAKALEKAVADMKVANAENAEASVAERMKIQQEHQQAITAQYQSFETQLKTLKLQQEQHNVLMKQESDAQSKRIDEKHAASLTALTKNLDEKSNNVQSLKNEIRALTQRVAENAKIVQDAPRISSPAVSATTLAQAEAIDKSGQNAGTTAGLSGSALQAQQENNTTGQALGWIEWLSGSGPSVSRLGAGTKPEEGLKGTASQLFKDDGGKAFKRLMHLQAVNNTADAATKEATDMLKGYEDHISSLRLSVAKDADDYIKKNLATRYDALKPKDGVTNGTNLNETMQSKNFGLAMAAVNLEAYAYSFGIDFETKNTYKVAELKAHTKNLVNKIASYINNAQGKEVVTAENLGITLRSHIDDECTFLKKNPS